MIFYLVQSYSVEDNADFYYTSTACINRVNEIAKTLSAIDSITIVSCTLPKTNKTKQHQEYCLFNNVKVFFPAVDKKTKKSIIVGCSNYISNSISKNDIIICYNSHFISALILRRIERASRFKIKVVSEVEELYSKSAYYSFFKKRLLSLCEKYIHKKSIASILACSNLLTKRLQQKPFVVSNGYLVGNYIANNVQGTIPLILYCGRLDDDSGIEDLLLSMAFVDFKCKLVICGGGKLEHLVSSFHPTNSNVDYSFVGFVSQKELDILLSNASVCVSTLKTSKPFSRFSFPSKIIEYLSFGNIIVSSDIEPLKDIPDCFLDQLIVYKEDKPFEIANKLKTGLNASLTLSREERILTFKKYYEKKRKDLCDLIDGLN